MQTYCLPSTLNEIGFDAMAPPVWKSHRGLPLSASSAKKLPSSEPEKTSPPPVERTPDQGAVCSGNSQRIFPVPTSSARIAPDFSLFGMSASPPPAKKVPGL